MIYETLYPSSFASKRFPVSRQRRQCWRFASFAANASGDYSGISVCDGFAGTGAVSKLFKQRGAHIIANDIQTYSYITLKHIVENNAETRLDASRFDELNALDGVDGFIYKHYCSGSGSGRMYYSDENGRKCDAIRQKIEEWRASGEISENEYYWYLASLIECIDKVANTASVYAAFLKHLKKSAQKELVVEPLPIIDGRIGTVLHGDILEQMPNIDCDILYLDPPYNSRQYPAYYHLLETIARYDNPDIPNTVTGVRNYRNQKSDWCVKTKVAGVFDKLLSLSNCEYVFLSYNNEGLMSFDDIRDIMSKYGSYELKTTEYHRFRADKQDARNHKADKTVECLHCLKKKHKHHG